MINKLILAVVTAVVITLVCILLGSILVGLNVGIAVVVGDFIHTYATALGILAGLWYYFSK